MDALNVFDLEFVSASHVRYGLRFFCRGLVETMKKTSTVLVVVAVLLALAYFYTPLGAAIVKKEGFESISVEEGFAIGVSVLIFIVVALTAYVVYKEW